MVVVAILPSENNPSLSLGLSRFSLKENATIWPHTSYGNYAIQAFGNYKESPMTEISSLVTNDKMLLGMSVTTAISGLLLRSCHDAGAGFVLPMCTSGGGELALNAASSGHCAGCYVAAAGLIGAFAVTVRRAFISR
jgi:hypothetical protein